MLLYILVAILVTPTTAHAYQDPPFDITAGGRVKATILLGERCPTLTTETEELLPEEIAGCAFNDPAHTIYWTDGSPLTLYHEIGHQVDNQLMDDRLRTVFTQYGLGRSPTRPWTQGSLRPTNIRQSPSSELFAEAFSMCALLPHVTIFDWFWLSAYLYENPVKRHKAACRFFMKV